MHDEICVICGKGLTLEHTFFLNGEKHGACTLCLTVIALVLEGEKSFSLYELPNN